MRASCLWGERGNVSPSVAPVMSVPVIPYIWCLKRSAPERGPEKTLVPVGPVALGQPVVPHLSG
jgi:hypothetical protein